MPAFAQNRKNINFQNDDQNENERKKEQRKEFRWNEGAGEKIMKNAFATSRIKTLEIFP